MYRPPPQIPPGEVMTHHGPPLNTGQAIPPYNYKRILPTHLLPPFYQLPTFSFTSFTSVFLIFKLE